MAITSGYNYNPAPQSGNGAFGQVPGDISLPNPYGDLSSVYPNLSSTNANLSTDINSKLTGTLSPSTLNALQNASATFGQASGMPGSGLTWNSLYGNIAGASENQQAQGVQEYNQTIPTVSGTQTVSPALQSEIAQTNSVWNSAPNPTAANNYAQQLYNQYLQSQRGPAGGTGTGTGTGTSATQPASATAPTNGANPYPNYPSPLGTDPLGPNSTIWGPQGYDPNLDPFNPSNDIYGSDSGDFGGQDLSSVYSDLSSLNLGSQ